jgi:hypothetical protein
MSSARFKIRLTAPSFEKISPACQANSFAAPNCRFEFDKRSQLFIGAHNETLSIAATSTCDFICLPKPAIRVLRTPTSSGSMNVTPFTIGGLPVDELSQGMIRLLREIADENGWTIEEVMTMAAEYYAARRQTEQELEAKIIEFPDELPGLS